MTQIWKFDLRHGEQRISAPGLGKALFFAIQGTKVRVWCKVRPGEPDRERIFYVVGTGSPIPPNGRHVGSLQDGSYVWHLFQAVPG